ncbi:hypothetical protein Btru_066060 [Bulinus truncatus]|nr:hypothetical protein Btru_066060 [Bulinus truncatus]
MRSWRARIMLSNLFGHAPATSMDWITERLAVRMTTPVPEKLNVRNVPSTPVIAITLDASVGEDSYCALGVGRNGLLCHSQNGVLLATTGLIQSSLVSEFPLAYAIGLPDLRALHHSTVSNGQLSARHLAGFNRPSLHEMFILQVILVAGMVGSVSLSTCSNISWSQSFDSVCQSKCQESNYYIRGFERNDLTNWNDDPISLLESDTGWPRYMDYLFNLESARCVKPTTPPFYYGSCYDEDTTACSVRKGRCLCKEGFFVTGLYRGNDDDLYNLDKMRCCSMADKPQVVDNAEELKDHIMDNTLRKMANLADMLGYDYSYGNRGVNVGKSVDHHCKRPESLNLTINNSTHNVMSNTSDYNVTFGKCSIDVLNGSDVIFTSHCSSGYQYVESYDSSFVPEWDLVCDRQYLSDTSQTVFVVGTFLGDILTRFADTSRRALPEQIQSFLWPVSLLLLCFIAYVSRHLSWRYVQLILSLIFVYTLCQPWIIDESLRWLLVAKKFDEAETLVKKIARINKVDPQIALELVKGIRVSDSETEAIGETDIKLLQVSNGQITSGQITQDLNAAAQNTSDFNLLVFVKNKNLLKLTVISSFVILVDALAYEGLLMISPELTSDFYLGFTLAAVIEFPASILFCLLINRIRRKMCIGIFHIVAGILLLISTVFLHTPLANIIPGKYWMSLTLSLLARLALATGYSAVLLYVPELFPTTIRNTGYGISSTLSYFASMISPYTRSVSKQYPWVPNVAFGLMCVAVPIVAHSLPETQGYEMPQTLADLESRIKNKQKKKVNTKDKIRLFTL